MDSIVRLRDRWDGICNEKAITLLVRVFGALSIFFATYAMALLFPFIGLIEGQLLLLIPLIIAISFFFNESLGIILFSVVLFAGMSGGQAAAALIAAMTCLFVCGNSRFICSLAVLVPICVMNITQIEASILSVNLPFFIFFICLYFNGKIANNTWKYIFPIYFTATAYNFGLYGQIVENFFSTVWPAKAYTNVDYDFMTLFTKYANFDVDFTQFDLISFLILALINLAVCYGGYSVLNIKNIKYLNLQLDVREAIATIITIILVTAGMVAVNKFYNPELLIPFGMMILHGTITYFVTRPFASYKVSKMLQQTKSIYDEEQTRKTLETYNYTKTLREEIENIIETYLLQSKFDTLLSADKTPISSILIYGKKELEKRFVVENILRNKGLDISYFRCNDLLHEYIEKGNIEALESNDNNEKLSIIVLEKVEELTNANIKNSDFRNKLLDYFISRIAEQRTNNKTLFIMTTDVPEMLPEVLYDNNCIDKVCYGSQKDSILLNGTYRVICPVGKGGGGEVYKAHHERLDAVVVVKKIINEFSNKSMYKAEAEALKKIKHMYLPKVYDVFEENKEYYTVIDFIPGRSFQEVLAEGGTFDENEVLLWAKQLVEAVSYLHNMERPIIHSDIKPGNIMLTPQGDICLIDFNISAVFDNGSLHSIGTTPGYSPIEQYGNIENYMSVLEQKGVSLKNSNNYNGNSISRSVCGETELKITNFISNETVIESNINKCDYKTVVHDEIDKDATVIDGQKGIDFSDTKVLKREENLDGLIEFARSGLSVKSDIYSIGATLYHLITGEKPSLSFYDIKPLKYYNTEYSTEFIYIVEKCMEIDPNKRYKDTNELKRDLDAIFN